MRFGQQMSDISDNANCSVAPVLRYRNIAAAIDWLCQTLGFQRQLILMNDAGSIRLAQLRLGDAMVMLVPINSSEYDGLMVQPDEVGGAETQISYFFLNNFTSHYAHSKAHGAEIILDHVDDRQGRRAYACRDPEGHVWSFGTYDPRSNKVHKPRRWAASIKSEIIDSVSTSLSAAFVISVAAIGVAFVVNAHLPHQVASSSIGSTLASTDRQASVNAGEALNENREQLRRALEREKQEIAEKQTALQALAEARQELEARTRENSVPLAQSVEISPKVGAEMSSASNPNERRPMRGAMTNLGGPVPAPSGSNVRIKRKAEAHAKKSSYYSAAREAAQRASQAAELLGAFGQFGVPQ